ncbi:MAG: prepilin-type N-terminal cleavage/methylation domain-containing protein [Acidobacteria bacterium]|nr:prepilin-type N-terminal cleavage/methylation domain-containing protein [Acidobacteriota bacterium]
MTPPRDAGFTLIEALVAVAVIAIVAGMVVPAVATGIRLYALNTAAQTVTSAVRSARYTAVSRNTKMRVRFHCPTTDQFRIVEVTGVSSIDDDVDRCSATAYPYPPADLDPDTLPNLDGPVQLLPSGAVFDAVEDVQIETTGRVTPLTGSLPVTIVVSNGSETQTITVTANGQVQTP